MHMPGVGDVLRAEPVSLAAWAGVAAIALCLVAAMELYKRLRRQRVTARNACPAPPV
jgi:hypothetical protein